MNEIARILVYGDLHLSSKNYGAHRNYPKDTLDVLKIITNKAEEFNATHIIGLGDLAFGRFNTLEYRSVVEEELKKQYDICNGNRYELKGNHDSAGYGMTEYEYYVLKGMLKPSTNLTIGNVCISMIDNGEVYKTMPNINDSEGYTNFIFMHDFFKFSDTRMPDYGKAYELDRFLPWYGVDYIIGGHIHNSEVFEGLMLKDIDGQTHGHRVMVDYLGSMSRPAYREGHTDEVGHILQLTIYDTGEFKYDRLDIELPSLAETFNLEAKAIEKEKKQAKENRVDIGDIVHRLDQHERNIGNPEDIIMSLDVPDKYKQKAIDLLKLGQS